MKDVLYNVFSAVEPLANDKKLGFKVEAQPDMPKGHGDERRLTQVVLNLVGNAIKFSDTGEVIIKATRDQRLVHGRRAGQRPGHLARPTRARSSRSSSRPTIPPPRRRAAPASACRSRGASSRCTAASSGSSPSSARARCSQFTLPVQVRAAGQAMKARGRKTTARTAKRGASGRAARAAQPARRRRPTTAALKRELAEAREQQQATAEVLRIIASSRRRARAGIRRHPRERASRICEAKFGNLWLREGDAFASPRCTARRPTYREFLRARAADQPDARTTSSARADQDEAGRVRSPTSRTQADGPRCGARASSSPARAALSCVPMLKDGDGDRRDRHLSPGGAAVHRQADRAGCRTSPRRPSSPSRTRGCSTSCASAPTISPSRWSSRPRPARCSRSSPARPASLSRCSQAMLENATRICEAKFGTLFRYDGEAFRTGACARCAARLCRAARSNATRFAPEPEHRLGRVAQTKHVVHIADITADAATRDDPSRCRRRARRRAHLAGVPMLKDDELIGVDHHLPPGGAAVHRQADRAGDRTSPPRPSSPSRTRGCSTNCASAPTISPNRWSSRPRPREVLKVISRSPFDLQTGVRHAGRIADAPLRGRAMASLFQREGDAFRIAAELSATAPRSTRRSAILFDGRRSRRTRQHHGPHHRSKPGRSRSRHHG